jgi:hypothetical protein
MLKALLIIPFLLAATPVAADPFHCTQKFVPDAALVGKGDLTYMIWHVYDAALYAPKGRFDENKTFSLKLTYKRNIEGRKIADTSAEEMRKHGMGDEIKLAAWHGMMRDIFPDITPGDSLTGVYTEKGHTVFCMGGKEIGKITDRDFGRWFFGIWLDEKTSAPDLRRKLLGEA